MTGNPNCEDAQNTAQKTAINTVKQLASKNMTLEKATSFLASATLLVNSQQNSTAITSIANSVETAMDNFIVSSDEVKSEEFISLIENFLNTFGTTIQNLNNSADVGNDDSRRRLTVNGNDKAQCSLLSIVEKTVNKYLRVSSNSIVPGEILSLHSNVISAITGNIAWKDS